MTVEVHEIDLEVHNEYNFYRIDDFVIMTDTWERKGRDCVLGLGTKGKAPIIMNFMLNHKELIKGKRILEPFAGAGPYGFLSLKLGAKHCDLLDINRRAVSFMHKNAELNKFNPSRYTIIENDFKLFRPDSLYDLILANPPYVPVPEVIKAPLHSKGGDDGCYFTNIILNKLDSLLKPDGEALIGSLQIESRHGPILESYINGYHTNRRIEMMRMSEAYIDFKLFVDELISARPESGETIKRWHLDLQRKYGEDLIMNWYLIHIRKKNLFLPGFFITDFDKELYGEDYAPVEIADKKKWVETLIRFEINR